MRCLLYYEPFGQTRQEKREGFRINGTSYILGDGFAHSSIDSAKCEMRYFARHLRREGWKVKGSVRQGYYETFREKKHRILYVRPVE